jgi:hypothetical protein
MRVAGACDDEFDDLLAAEVPTEVPEPFFLLPRRLLGVTLGLTAGAGAGALATGTGTSGTGAVL